jgi:teichuronic acid biosynthesis glycosyltransferase TuaH
VTPVRVAVVSSARWSSFHLTKQLVATALAQRAHQVLYVDPPVSPGSVVRNPRRWRDLLGPRLFEGTDGVRVWRPLLFPGQNQELVQRVNARAQLAGLGRHLGPPDLTIVFSLEGRGLLARVGGHRVFYVTDSAADLPGAHPQTRAWEDALIASAHTVIACSPPLVADLRDRGVDPVYLPHGCDKSFIVTRSTVPDRLADLPRPLLGYVGSVNFRIDTTLLEEVLSLGTIVVIGGAFGRAPEPRAQRFLAHPRVVTLGHCPPQLLPDYVAALDVGLVPYSMIPFNRKSSPAKILQYLGAGLPVVSTPNGATDELGKAVRVAHDPKSFAAAVGEALDDRTPQAAQARRDIARSRSWDSVAASIEDLCRTN